MFSYALFAHAVGMPTSEDPGHPDFHVPRTFTGVGDFPGGDYIVTLGAFDDVAGLPVGTPFMQASTMMHEWGHGFERRHGGDAFEPNCKPLYFSPMNYVYQLRGLLDDAGVPHLDFSRDDFTGFAINETSLFDGSLSQLPYRIGWYAPLATSYLSALGTPVAKHCDGSPLLATDPAMVRIDARTAASAIDWKANGTLEPSPLFSQDVNFNGRTTKPDLSPEVLAGSNDWAKIVLNQVGARRSAGGLFFDSMGRASWGRYRSMRVVGISVGAISAGATWGAAIWDVATWGAAIWDVATSVGVTWARFSAAAIWGAAISAAEICSWAAPVSPSASSTSKRPGTWRRRRRTNSGLA